MSAKLMGMVFELDVTTNEQIVLIALADHARDDGEAVYPSVGYLAWKTNRDVRTVQRILRSLEQKEIIRLVDNADGGRRRSRHYVLQLDNAPRKPKYRDESTLEEIREARRQRAEKGDNLTPFDDAERVTFATRKGDKSRIERVTPMSPEPLVEPSEEPTTAAARASDVAVDPETDEERQVIDQLVAVPLIAHQPRADVLAVYRDTVRARGPRSPAADASDALRFRLHYAGDGLLSRPLTNWRLAIAQWFSRTRDTDATRTATHPDGHRGYATPRYSDPRAERPIVAGVRRRAGVG